jgi:hypothetical protein
MGNVERRLARPPGRPSIHVRFGSRCRGPLARGSRPPTGESGGHGCNPSPLGREATTRAPEITRSCRGEAVRFFHLPVSSRGCVYLSGAISLLQKHRAAAGGDAECRTATDVAVHGGLVTGSLVVPLLNGLAASRRHDATKKELTYAPCRPPEPCSWNLESLGRSGKSWGATTRPALGIPPWLTNQRLLCFPLQSSLAKQRNHRRQRQRYLRPLHPAPRTWIRRVGGR